MNAREITFGVEIETIAPASATEEGLRIGPSKRGIQVPYLPAGWTAEADGSIAATGGRACEIVSPVLRGEEGILQVIEVINTLRAKGHRVVDVRPCTPCTFRQRSLAYADVRSVPLSCVATLWLHLAVSGAM